MKSKEKLVKDLTTAELERINSRQMHPFTNLEHLRSYLQYHETIQKMARDEEKKGGR